MPEKSIYAPIEGASHAQFGNYGPQKGDVNPRITLDRQHEMVTELMMEFISGH